MCLLVNELKARKDEFDTVVTVTGQLAEILDQELRVFDVNSDHYLAIMKPDQTLFDVTCDVLVKLKAVLEDEKRDVLLFHGDTTTSFVAALACFYLQIPVGHVEVDLRTHVIFCPWPEKFNRQAVYIVSEYSFAPTEASKKNLLGDGKPESRVWVTGNTGIDALRIDALRTAVREGYSYPELEWAEGSRLILTDSGGIQEETLSPGKPVLVMRHTTERPKGVAAGTLKLFGNEEGVIYREFSCLLSDEFEYESMSHASNSYGDGHASERISDALVRGLCRDISCRSYYLTGYSHLEPIRVTRRIQIFDWRCQ